MKTTEAVSKCLDAMETAEDSDIIVQTPSGYQPVGDVYYSPHLDKVIISTTAEVEEAKCQKS